MSDDAAPTKRGRKAVIEKKEKEVESKKRSRKEVKSNDAGDSGDDGAAPVKRGRGRPKGTTKRRAAPKAKAVSKSGPGRRGRPKKEEKKEENSEEDGEDNDDAGDDDDE